MAFYPEVYPGEAFVPSAAEENDVRRLLNKFNGSSAPLMSRENSDAVRVSVWNSSSDTIRNGSAVVPSKAYSLGDAVAVRGYTTGDGGYWILDGNDLEPNNTGTALICGVIIVKASPGEGDYLAPTDTGEWSITADKTACRILYHPSGTEDEDVECAVLLSFGSEKSTITITDSEVNIDPLSPWTAYTCTTPVTSLKITGCTVSSESTIAFVADSSGITVTVDSNAKWVWGRGAFLPGKRYTLCILNNVIAMAEVW